jgi:hypothetical protein
VDRNLARRNLKTGLVMAAVAAFFFGISFAIAAAYIT